MRVAPAHPRRLAYLGSPEAAVAPLHALVAAGFEVVCVVTQPDRRRGRGSALVPTPVKAAAVGLGLPVTDRVDSVIDAGVDLGVVVAFGRIIRPHVLDAVPMVNLHFSLLPRWRGAAPVERAVLAGDPVTGVCVMEVADGLDEGGVYARAEVPIGAEQTAAELRAELVAVGSELLVATLSAGLGEPEAQVGEVTYAAKIDSAELRIDWSEPAERCGRLVRVGGAHTTFRGTRLKILRARVSAESTSIREDGAESTSNPRSRGSLEGDLVVCGDGNLLQLLEVQPEGRAPMTASAWRNGARPEPGEVLGP